MQQHSPAAVADLKALSEPIQVGHFKIRNRMASMDHPVSIARKPQPDGGGFALYRVGDAVAGRGLHAAVCDSPRLCRVL